jgi:glutamine cyclotransferase
MIRQLLRRSLLAMLRIRPRVDASVVGREFSHQGFRVTAAYPHDAGAFTQGLAFHDGAFYESTGLNGRSTLRQVELATGRVLRCHRLDRRHFGEGLAVVGRHIIQLTWHSGLAFRYHRDSFEVLATHDYPTEGWGITFDGDRLIMSDGSSTLYLRDPKTFSEIGRLEVRADHETVAGLNDLQYVDGEILANVFTRNLVARISAASGRLLGWIDLSDLAGLRENRARAQVLNGITNDPRRGVVLVTGKLWPRVFEIELVR